MAESYWTNCMYCGEMICGVEVLEEYTPMSLSSMRTRPVMKDTRIEKQLPLFQEGNKTKNALPVYRVTLVREGQIPSYEHRIRSSADACRMLATYLADVDREHFVVLLLDQKNQVIGIHTVSMGSLTASIVHPREVYKAAILANAAAIICGHNHPSGDTQPSREDRAITLRLVDAGKLLGISVLDHIIIGSAGKYFSFADEGLEHSLGEPMDPNATWQMLCAYLRALHQNPNDEEIRANAVMLLEALTRWLRRGGFPPMIHQDQHRPQEDA